MSEALRVQPIGQAMRAPKTAELIASDLRKKIVQGQLTPGQTLPPEVTLMEQYDVSRPTLREAFRILEAETLISVRRGSRGGAQVMKPDLTVAARSVGVVLQFNGTTIDDVYEARTIIEPPCAGLLAKNRTDDDIAALQAVVDEITDITVAGPRAVPDPAAWSDLIFRFHYLILQQCGNKTLAVQGGVLADIVRTHLYLRVAQSLEEGESPQRFQRVIKAYQRLIDLVTSRDAAGAEKHWRRHMEVAGTFVLKDDLEHKRVVDLFA
jgi:GntR family transcriptional repressor for pyruvate dehydrogenase complex